MSEPKHSVLWGGRDRTELFFWLALLTFAVVVFLLRTTYLSLGDMAAGHAGTVPQRAMEEATGTITAVMLVLWIVWVSRRFPLRSTTTPRLLMAHAFGFVVYTMAHTFLIAAARSVMAPAMGLEGYSYGPIGIRLLQEAPNDALFYVLLVAAVTSFDLWRVRRLRERRYLEIEGELSRAQLANLQLQLQPHFLFNALNTISSVMYDDPAAADEMVGHLGDLLRRTLATAGRAEVPLSEELELLDSYLALARARFGASLAVRLEVDPAVTSVLVPPLLLQPLVENAVRHGIAPGGRGDVTIAARRDDQGVMLTVENDIVSEGRVDDEPRITERGLGLSLTSRRLALLHGPDANISSGPTEDGRRYRVYLRLPWKTVDRTAIPQSAASASADR